MTQKERYEIALSGKAADMVPWAVNFDHWWDVNKKQGTLPRKYVGLTRYEIWRSLGVAMWARTRLYKEERPNVKQTHSVDGSVEIVSYETPVGTLYEKYQLATDFTRARFLVEHMVKSLEDLPAYKFYVQDTVATPDYTHALRMMEDVGDDGIVLAPGPDTPYQAFMISVAGWVTGIYMLMDHPSEVEEVFEIMAEKNLETYEIMARSPVWVYQEGDNMDVMTSPEHYRKYVIPFGKRAAAVHHKHGKLYQSHYDGSIGNHLPLIPETGLDCIEAVTPAPMGDFTMKDAFRHLGGKVVMQGGVPSVTLCHGFPLDELKGLVLEALELGKQGGFVLGMGDNVPPDADFSRIDFITELVEKHGRIG